MDKRLTVAQTISGWTFSIIAIFPNFARMNHNSKLPRYHMLSKSQPRGRSQKPEVAPPRLCLVFKKEIWAWSQQRSGTLILTPRSNKSRHPIATGSNTCCHHLFQPLANFSRELTSSPSCHLLLPQANGAASPLPALNPSPRRPLPACFSRKWTSLSRTCSARVNMPFNARPLRQQAISCCRRQLAPRVDNALYCPPA